MLLLGLPDDTVGSPDVQVGGLVDESVYSLPTATGD